MRKITLFIVLFVFFIMNFGSVWACTPQVDPDCTCDSDANANSSSNSNATGIGVGLGVGVGMADVDTNVGIGVITSNNVNNMNKVNSESNSVSEGGNVEFSNGDTSAIIGDVAGGNVLNETTALGGYGGQAHTGDNTNNISMNSYGDQSIRLPNAPVTYEKIGDVERSTTSLSFFGGASDANYRRKDSYIVGAIVTIPLGNKHSRFALEIAEDKISKERDYISAQNTVLMAENVRAETRHKQEMDRMKEELQELKEKHQYEMSMEYISMHKILFEKNPEMSQEIKQRCTAFEHTNNKETNDLLDQMYPTGPHNQEIDNKPNPNQVMSHSQGYMNEEIKTTVIVE